MEVDQELQETMLYIKQLVEGWPTASEIVEALAKSRKKIEDTSETIIDNINSAFESLGK